MVMSTFDKLREQLALPSPARPVEPTYPAPALPPGCVLSEECCGLQRYGRQHSVPYGTEAEHGSYKSQHDLPHIPPPPDVQAPILHPHMHHLRQAESARPHGYGRPAVEGLDDNSEMHPSEVILPVTSFSSRSVAEEYGNAADRRARQDQTASDMEQQLELVAVSLRGDQDEAAGVRKGLMMLQACSDVKDVATVRSDQKAGSRSPTLKGQSRDEVPRLSFPVLLRDPAADPPLVPFSDVPLWLPTWHKTALDRTPSDKKQDTEELDSLPLITSASDQSEETTYTFTPGADSPVLASTAANESVLGSPAVLLQNSAQSQHLASSMNSVSAHPGSHDMHTHFQDVYKHNAPQRDLPDMQVQRPPTPDSTTTCLPMQTADTLAPFRNVQVVRDPSAPQDTLGGIGLQFARPRGQMGPAHILAMTSEGTAFKSGLVKVGDLMHQVDGVDIHNLQPQEITRLILGAPSTYVTLQLSDGPDRSTETGRSKTMASPAATGGSSVVITPRSIHRAGTLGGFKTKASPRKPADPDRLPAYAGTAPDQNRGALPQVEGIQTDSVSLKSQREVTIVRADGTEGSFTGIGIQFGRRKQNKDESTYMIQGMKPDFPAAKSGLIALGDLLHAVNGQPVVHLSIEEITKLVLGPPSTPVKLLLTAPSTNPTAASPPLHTTSLPVTFDPPGMRPSTLMDLAGSTSALKQPPQHAHQPVPQLHSMSASIPPDDSGNGAVHSAGATQQVHNQGSQQFPSMPNAAPKSIPVMVTPGKPVETGFEGGALFPDRTSTTWADSVGEVHGPGQSHNLPEGWERRVDAQTGREYYLDHATRTTSWFPPEPTPFTLDSKLTPRTSKFNFFLRGFRAPSL